VTLDRLIGGGTERAGGQVFFGNSGAEANECALKLARRWAGPGRFAVVSTWDAFHGRTLATLAATGQPEKQQAFLPLPEGFDHVPFDDLDAMDVACDPDPGGGRPGRAGHGRGRGGGSLVGLPGRPAELCTTGTSC
jgi:acetylornithine/N-succinyldiaminopimelate aminotransferase